mgnify:CR=1 FL=1
MSDYQKLHEWLHTCPVPIHEVVDYTGQVVNCDPVITDLTDFIQVSFAIELEPDEEDGDE